ncbi:MAG: hypothetical protein RLZZ299_1230 [Pseudomonadota bacterium]
MTHPLLTRALACLLLAAPVVAHAGTLRVDVLDIGQGDSILIRSPGGKTVLIDAGDGTRDVPPLLAKEGVGSLDLVIGTHPHADHIGGMDEVVAAVPIRNYLDNGLPHTTATYRTLMADLEAKGIPYRAAVRGQTFNLDDGATLEVLFPTASPLKNTRSDLNANSVVVRLRHQGHCMLFVGDSEEPTEHALTGEGLGPCEVLKVAHHGSNHSSVASFLAAVQPKVALISVGVDNRYRHPGVETMKRLTDVGATLYRTDLQGQLTVLSSEKGVEVRTERVSPLPLTATYAEVAAQNGITDPRGAHTRHGDPPRTESMSDQAEGEGKRARAASSHGAEGGTPSATPPPTPGEACPFVSGASDKFHEASCGNAHKIKAEKRACHATRDAAVAAGKVPAGCCKP